MPILVAQLHFAAEQRLLAVYECVHTGGRDKRSVNKCRLKSGLGLCLLPAAMGSDKGGLQLRGLCLITSTGVDLLSLSVSKQHGLSLMRKRNIPRPVLMSPLSYFVQEFRIYTVYVCVSKYYIQNYI